MVGWVARVDGVRFFETVIANSVARMFAFCLSFVYIVFFDYPDTCGTAAVRVG